MPQITITVSEITLPATLNDSPTARQIATHLPLRGAANVWGDEIYFEIPVQATEAADAVEEVEIGTLAYWPPGNAFCIFYGKTPVNTDGSISKLLPGLVEEHIKP